MHKRLHRNWNIKRKISLYQFTRHLYVITVRSDKTINWYPVNGTEGEAIYAYNRIMTCFDKKKPFIVNRRGDEKGERVITDPAAVESYYADIAAKEQGEEG